MAPESGKDRLAKHKATRIEMGLKELRSCWIPNRQKAIDEMQELAKDLRRRYKMKLPTD